MMNGQLITREVPVVRYDPRGIHKIYGGDQEDKLMHAVEMIKERSAYFSSMEDDEAAHELEGVASAQGMDVDDPNTSASDIVDAFYGEHHIHSSYDEEE